MAPSSARRAAANPPTRASIRTATADLAVAQVASADGEVLHQGTLLTGELAADDEVTLAVDQALPDHHARLHTGGNLVMTAVDRLLGLPATKGYHFPQGPYVEFDGIVPVERRADLVDEVQKVLDERVAEDSAVTWSFDDVDNLRAQGVYIPAEIPAGKPTRVVTTAGYRSPCGGPTFAGSACSATSPPAASRSSPGRPASPTRSPDIGGILAWRFTMEGLLNDVSTTGSSPVYLLFDVAQAGVLSRSLLADLAAGTSAAIRIPGFLAESVCAEIMETLESHELSSYDEELVFPRIAKLGPTAYDYYADGDLPAEYFLAAEKARDVRSRLSAFGDPLDQISKQFEESLGVPLELATTRGRPLFGGILREINNGAKIHFDEVVREMPGALDEAPIVQLAFNCHLAMPRSGGDCVIHRRRWSPADESRRDGYGYAASVVEGLPSAGVRAEVGDAILFDPRNYHSVTPNDGGDRRVTLSFFVGVTLSGRLLYWS